MRKKFLLIFLFSTIFLFSEEKLTLTFYQTKLAQVLQVLSMKTGIKLIASSELAERPISAYLENVSGEEAIDSILRANGLYREKLPDSDVYVVKEYKEIQKLTSEVIFLQYSKAEDLGKVLSSLISKNGKIIVDTRTNSLTVQDIPENIEEIKKIVKLLDRNIPSVQIEAVLVELTEEGLKDLGIKWNVEGSFFGAAKDVPYPWTKEFEREIVNPRQTGITGGTTTTTTGNPQFILGTLSFQALTANLKLLEVKGQANILANPRVTTLNDSPATIKITKNMAIAEKVVYTYGAAGTIAPTTKEPIFAEVGVTLNVTPHVNEQGYITLEVEPSVSSAEPSPYFAEAVDTNIRTAKTKVMVKNGETIVIGGLLRTEKTQRGNKVPLLGDIFPFLFKNKSETGRKTDLVIFLTPKIITEKEVKEISEKEKTRFEEKNEKK
ncbi:MAG: type II secretion system protein GspD [Candidatus Ratteibacteria bacterium]